MERLDATTVEFLVNGKALSQVLADGGGNLTVLAYDKAVRLYSFAGEGSTSIVLFVQLVVS